MPTYPLVLIQWTDTICNTQWRHDEDVDEWAGEQKWLVSDVGYLLRKTEEYVVLAGSWAKAEGQFKNLSKIPRGMVKVIRELDESEAQDG
jgi:hypothetical protein